jgi:hypothetical protein
MAWIMASDGGRGKNEWTQIAPCRAVNGKLAQIPLSTIAPAKRIIVGRNGETVEERAEPPEIGNPKAR